MRIVKDSDIYKEVVVGGMLQASRFLWIATANIKDMHVRGRRRYHSIVDDFARMVEHAVQIRLIHASRPSARFQESLERHAALARAIEILHCPRVHFKTVIVDGKWAYLGSANFTGAGLGAKSDRRRNFEAGVIFEKPESVREMMDYFDAIWMGAHCPRCGLRDACPQPIE